MVEAFTKKTVKTNEDPFLYLTRKVSRLIIMTNKRIMKLKKHGKHIPKMVAYFGVLKYLQKELFYEAFVELTVKVIKFKEFQNSVFHSFYNPSQPISMIRKVIQGHFIDCILALIMLCEN